MFSLTIHLLRLLVRHLLLSRQKRRVASLNCSTRSYRMEGRVGRPQLEHRNKWEPQLTGIRVRIGMPRFDLRYSSGGVV